MVEVPRAEDKNSPSPPVVCTSTTQQTGVRDRLPQKNEGRELLNTGEDLILKRKRSADKPLSVQQVPTEAALEGGIIKSDKKGTGDTDGTTRQNQDNVESKETLEEEKGVITEKPKEDTVCGLGGGANLGVNSSGSDANEEQGQIVDLHLKSEVFVEKNEASHQNKTGTLITEKGTVSDRGNGLIGGQNPQGKL